MYILLYILYSNMCLLRVMLNVMQAMLVMADCHKIIIMPCHARTQRTSTVSLSTLV